MKTSELLSQRQLNQLPTIDQIDLHLSGRYFDQFVLGAWKILEPVTQFISNWHIEAISEHLMAVLRWEIKDIIFNIPPRFMKSLLISVMFPAYGWIEYPHLRFLCSSYADNLSTRDSVKCRRIVQSPWYQAVWAERNGSNKNFPEDKRVLELVDDQNQKTRFDNNHTGYRLSTTVDGTNTGEGGDILICDDPNNIKKVESDVERGKVNDWWKEVMSTRRNDPKKSARIIIQQRTHENDLTGYILGQELKYDLLHIPMRYEPKVLSYTKLDFKDPRVVEGELLWPDRYDEEAVSGLEKELGEYAAAGQFQQSPHPRGGGLFKVDNFTRIDRLTLHIVDVVRYWDKAGTKGGHGARTAGVKMAKLSDGKYCVMHVVKGRWSAGKRESIIKSTAELDGKEVKIWVEQEPGSGGKESAENTVTNLDGYVARKEPVTGAKEVRAEPYAAQVENGNMYIINSDWTEEFLSEHESAPVGKYKDQWDAAAGAFNKLVKSGGLIW